jgi:hypothetical protein
VARPMSFENERAQVQNNIRQNSHFSPINGTQANSGNPRSPANEANNRVGAPRQGMNSGSASEAQRSALARLGNSGSNSGWRSFGQGGAANNTQPRSFGNHTAAPVERSTGNSGWNSAPRPGSSNDRVATPSRGTNNGGGWQRFTPTPSRPSPAESMSRAPQNDSWRQSSRAPASESRSYGNYSRPPLSMRQPIVTPRGRDYSRPSYSRPSYGGSDGGNRGGYSAPSRGGYSAPSGHGGGSAPRGGGGGSHSGGGGSHSSGGNHHGR